MFVKPRDKNFRFFSSDDYVYQLGVLHNTFETRNRNPCPSQYCSYECNLDGSSWVSCRRYDIAVYRNCFATCRNPNSRHRLLWQLFGMLSDFWLFRLYAINSGSMLELCSCQSDYVALFTFYIEWTKPMIDLTKMLYYNKMFFF